jgi:hypothetical protein
VASSPSVAASLDEIRQRGEEAAQAVPHQARSTSAAKP